MYLYMNYLRKFCQFRRETRSRDKIIFDEANYKLYALAEASPAWEEEERALIDLKLLLGFIYKPSII